MIIKHQSVFSLVLGIVLTSVIGCGGEEDAGAIATLSWDPVIHDTAVSYTVHFGKESSGELGSCNYENSVDVSEPFATIARLEFNTRYYFAVSAYDGQRSLCSMEVSKLMTLPIGHDEDGAPVTVQALTDPLRHLRFKSCAQTSRARTWSRSTFS